MSTFAWVACLKVFSFNYFRVYQGWGRYVTFHDLTLLLKAATASSFAILLMDFLLYPGLSTPRSVFLMDWGLTIVTIGGIRSLARLLEEQELSSWLAQGHTPALIVGANDSGEALLRAIRRNPRLTYRVVGFIAEDRKAVGTQIGGVPVIGQLADTCELARKHRHFGCLHHGRRVGGATGPPVGGPDSARPKSTCGSCRVTSSC